MKYLISGGTGLVGTAITKQLLQNGHQVMVLSRNGKARAEWLDGEVSRSKWDPANQVIDQEAVKTAHVIINLAGSSVSQRWTEANRRSILNSRVDSTSTLVNAMQGLASKPFISASAIGLYADSDELQDESSPATEGFLSDVVVRWEQEAEKAQEFGHRVVMLRIGLVLAKEGGALKSLAPIFKLGIGSAVGSGKQWQSWIHIDDLAALFIQAGNEDSWGGAMNAVAPNPVSNKTFSKALAKTLGRPFWAPNVPAFVLKLVFGKMSQVVLASQKVSSKKTEAAGFNFQYTQIQDALNSIYRS